MKKIMLFSTIVTIVGYLFFNYSQNTEAQTSNGFIDPQLNSAATAFAFQADGQMLVGGGFSTVGGQPITKIVRLNPDGTRDTSFTPPTISGNQVLDIAIQSDGKILVAGFISISSPQSQSHIIRLNSDGSFDNSFITNINDDVYSVSIQNDGKIVIGGDFTSIDGMTRRKVARLNSNGSIDATFLDLNVNGTENFTEALVYKVKSQQDGKILVGGNFTNIGGQARKALARLTVNGTIDNTFTDPNLSDGRGVRIGSDQASTIVNSIGLQSDGKLVIGGAIRKVNGQDRDNLTRLNADGTLDTTFQFAPITNGPANSFLTALEIQPNGKLIIGGNFNGISGITRNGIARLNADGSLDQSFIDANVSEGLILGLGLQADGKILIGGLFRVVNGRRRLRFTRLESNGLLDVPSPKTFVVTKTADTDDGVCDADCSLREAIKATNLAISDDTIEFSPNLLGSSNQFTLTLGQLSICNEGKLNLNGDGSNNIIISGNDNSRVMRVFLGGFVTIKNVNITNGNTSAGFPGSPCPITSASSVGGGGIENQGTLFIEDSLIANNISTSSAGGLANVFGNVTISNSVIENNMASDHAGILNRGINNTNFGTLKLMNSRVSGNNTFNGKTSKGGGIGNLSDATLEIIKSTVNNNSAFDRGGGIYNESANVIITNSTLSQNTANFGGGILNTQGQMTLNSSTIAFNNATTLGGGVLLIQTQPFGTITAANTIFSNNISPSSPDYSGGLMSQGFNLIKDASGVGIAGTTTGNQIGIDPLLDPQLTESNSILFHNLNKQSPAIDKGKNFDTNEDQRGKIRPFDYPDIPNANSGDGSDIGAIEDQPIVKSPQSAPIDFDGDGRTDISIFRAGPNPAQYWLLRSSDGGNNAYSFGLGSDKPVPADYTGDGKTDLAFFRESTNEWFVLRSEDSSFYSFPFGASGDIPAPGDFDGDGIADVAVYRPSSGTWFILRSSDGNTDFVGFGIAEDKPTVADYDGDGMDDIAIYRPSNSQWWLNRSSDGVIVYQFGQTGDQTVPGDHTGDGKADVAFWRPSSGEWFVIRSEDQSFYSYPFGSNGDIPSPGDYDGDGTFDAAVFRPSTTTWFINGSTSGTQILGFGLSDDIPLANSFVRD